MQNISVVDVLMGSKYASADSDETNWKCTVNLSVQVWKTLVMKIDLTVRWDNTQLTFTCSKSTIETLGKDVKYVQN